VKVRQLFMEPWRWMLVLVYRCRGMPIIANMPSVLLVFFSLSNVRGEVTGEQIKLQISKLDFPVDFFISMVVVGLLAAATATVGRGRYFNT